MKKHLLFLIFIGLFLLVPISVDAATVTSSIFCSPANAKKGDNITCNITVVATDGAIKDVVVNYGVDSGLTLTSASPFTNNEEIADAASKTFEGAITLTAGDTPGDYNVNITSVSATNVDDSLPATEGANTNYSRTITILSDNVKLSSLTVDGVSPTNFSPDTFSYDVQVRKSYIKIDANGETGVTVKSGYGTRSLVCGDNSFEIKTEAKDGTIGTYNLKINRVCSNDSTLKNVSISSGSLSPAFSSNRKSYTIEVESNVSSIVFKTVKNDNSQNVDEIITKSLNYGSNQASITVTAEDGSKSAYSFTINRKDDRSTDATLSNIELSDGKITFDKETTEYKFKVLYDVSAITVTPTPSDVKSTVEVVGGNPLAVGDNVITIKVTAENKTEKVYTINVTRLAEGVDMGNNPNASNITVEGYELNFKPTTYNYSLKIKNEKELVINVDMEEKSAEYSIRNNSNLKDGTIITIVTSSEDGSSLTYKITISKDSYLWLWILIAILVIAIIIVIIVFVVKKKKNDEDDDKTKKESVTEDKKTEDKKIESDDSDTKVIKKKEVKTNVISDKELLDKVEKQIKQTDVLSNEELRGLGETKAKVDSISPISILAKKPVDDSRNVNNISDEIEKKTMATRSERFVDNNEKIIQEPKAESEYKKEVIEHQHVDSNASSTKICSICGHRVPATAKVCPYCRRIWN